jgi:SpoVK/Ycf46/Vps4 family AAA+-type ATPase
MSNSFIKWLDDYHDKTNLSSFDYSVMTTIINKHFNSELVDGLPLCFFPEQPAVKKTHYEDPYFIWQQKHEFFTPFNQSNKGIVDMCIENTNRHKQDLLNVDSFKTIIVKEKRVIESTIETLDDLIKLIDHNPCDLDIEYNIDLKSLHKIKPELVQLNDMIGLVDLKKSILEQLLYFVQNLCMNDFKHTALLGPPGTGKTEIAKIVGRMYSKIGILKNDVFKKVTRNDLIAGYLGQTAIKTRKVIDECLGGVLFIDEAYSLASAGDTNDSYSKECIDILCEALSDHKDDLMVIIAGYEEELNETFFKVNKGMHSRFVWRFKMEPYSPKDMMKIFIKLVAQQEWNIINDELNEKWFDERKDNFIYFGRDMELLVTYTKIAHSRRIYGKDVSLRKIITIEDVNNGYKTFLKNKKEKKDQQYLYGLYV